MLFDSSSCVTCFLSLSFGVTSLLSEFLVLLRFCVAGPLCYFASVLLVVSVKCVTCLFLYCLWLEFCDILLFPCFVFRVLCYSLQI